ncbi:MAG TPA: hypothetical protein VFK03_00575, partial [Candidatus Saccharimonadales bacterium]|nr:hypothetical protein [Candidatus Saccharimonadales bacterium]
GSSALTIAGSGDISFGANADHLLSVVKSSAGAGKNLTVQAGAAATGSNLAGGNLILAGGNGDGTGANGGVIVKSAPSGSATGFQVQDGGGIGLLTVNTASKLLQVGSATANTNPALLVLNNFSSAVDPANGTNGAMYYNTSTNIYRCFTAGTWKNCAGAGGGIGGSGTAGAIAMFNDTYNLGPSILTQPDSSTIQVGGTLKATTALQAPTVNLGTSGTTNGTAVFRAAGGTNTVTLGLNGNPDQSYNLYLPTVHPGTSQCLKTGFNDASQLAFGDCMAPTTPVFVQQTTNSSNGTTSLSTALTSTSQQGDLLVAVIATNGSTANVSSVGDASGNTWVKAAGGFTAGSDAEIWYAANTNPAANVTVNLSSSSAIAVNINEYAGVAAVNALEIGQGQGNGNAKTFSTPSITTGMDHDLVIAGVAYDGSKIVFPTTTGWNTLTTAAGIIGVQSSYRDAVTAGANQFDWNTSSSITTGTVIAAFRPAGNGADYAEMYGTSDASIEAADIVALDPTREASSNGDKAWIVKTDHANQTSTLGVISTHPGMIIGQLFKPSENPRAVALDGRVPVKVNGQNGPIKPGDFITTSSTPGVGMKAAAAGQVVGQALSSFDGKGQGKVTMFIKNTYYAGNDTGSIAIGSLTNSVSSVNSTGLVTDSTDIQATSQPNLSSDSQPITSTNETDTLTVQGDQLNKLLSLKSNDKLLVVGDGNPTLASTGKGDLFVGGHLEVSTALRVGDGVNGLNFQLGVAPSSAHGFFLGDSRPVRTVAMAPEYNGLVTSGADNGKLTVDFDDDHNYYQWTTTQSDPQTVKFNLRLPVPRDWSDWTKDDKICYNVWTSDLDNSVQATVYDTANQSNGNYDATPDKTEAWQTKCSDKLGGEVTVNGQSYLRVKLELTARPGETVRLGEFNFDYLSAF